VQPINKVTLRTTTEENLDVVATRVTHRGAAGTRCHGQWAPLLQSRDITGTLSGLAAHAASA